MSDRIKRNFLRVLCARIPVLLKSHCINRHVNLVWKKPLLPTIFLTLLLTGIAFSSDSLAPDSTKSNSTLDKNRPWDISIPIWIPLFSGQFAIGDVVIEGEPESGDSILDKVINKNFGIEFYLVGEINYTLNRWKFHFDFFTGKISESVTFNTSEKDIVDASIQLGLPRAVVAYDIIQPEKKFWIFDELNFYTGLRYYNVAIDAELNRTGNFHSIKTNWTDILLGTQLYIPTAKKLDIILNGDFGLGSGDKVSFFYNIGLNYQFNSLISTKLGWNSININKQRMVDSVPFNLQIKLAGPMLSLGFNF